MQKTETDMSDEDEEDQTSASYKAFDHAWAWFEYHAGQRISVMRFAITVLGGVSAACGLLHSQRDHFLAALIAALGAFLSWCFQRFDRRASALVKIGEAAMRAQQAKLAETTGCPEFNICVRADILSGGRAETYSQILILIYGAVGVSLLSFAVCELISSEHFMIAVRSVIRLLVDRLKSL